MTRMVIRTDVATYTVPSRIAARLSSVPRTKDGAFDRRYRIGRDAAEWERRQNELAVAAFERGEAFEVTE